LTGALIRLEDEGLVTRLAALARLELAPDEATRLGRDLQSILGHVERLNELALDDVGATYWSVGAGVAMRPDEPGECLGVEDGLGCAAARDERLLVVPSMREES